MVKKRRKKPIPVHKAPRSDGVLITRIDAALRQLNEAIRMFFEGRDDVAIHTLAGAASGVLHDLAGQEGVTTWLDQINAISTKDDVEWREKALRQCQNFFKHADAEGQTRGDTIEYSLGETVCILMAAVYAANALGVPPTAEYIVFAGWAFIQYPELMSGAQLPANLTAFLNSPDARAMDKPAFRKMISSWQKPISKPKKRPSQNSG
jgi:hypothetical protein